MGEQSLIARGDLGCELGVTTSNTPPAPASPQMRAAPTLSVKSRTSRRAAAPTGTRGHHQTGPCLNRAHSPGRRHRPCLLRRRAHQKAGGTCGPRRRRPRAPRRRSERSEYRRMKMQLQWRGGSVMTAGRRQEIAAGPGAAFARDRSRRQLVLRARENKPRGEQSDPAPDCHRSVAAHREQTLSETSLP